MNTNEKPYGDFEDFDEALEYAETHGLKTVPKYLKDIEFGDGMMFFGDVMICAPMGFLDDLETNT